MRNNYVRWLMLLALSCFVQMTFAQNDECANAILIGPGVTSGTTVGAAIDTGLPTCGTDVTAPGVWYTFTGNGGTADIDVCGGGFYDSKLNAYSGSCGALVCETGNDDSFLCGFFSVRSAISFSTTNGETYYVLVQGFSGAVGSFDLNFALSPPPPPAPANDLCANAEPIACGDSKTANTSGGTIEGGPTCGDALGTEGPDAWYTFTGTGDFVTISTCNPGTDYDTQLGIYTGTCGNFTCVTGDDQDFDCAFSADHTTVEFLSVAGTVYYVRAYGWDGFNDGAGNFELTVDCIPAIPPANDDCTGAEPIAVGDTKTGSNRFAADESGNFSVGGCNGVTYDGSGGVWFSYIGDGNPVTFASCGSSYDTKLNVYQPFPGNCTVALCLTASDDDCGDDALVSVATTAGQEYLILLHADGDERGDYVLQALPGANNDDCVDALPVSCGSIVTGTTLGSNTETVPAGCGTAYTAGGVWYKITGADASITAELCGSAYDTKLFVYEGSCTNLICVGGNDDACGLQSRVTWAGVNGIEYYILVSGFSANQGDYELSIICPPPVLNDFCTGAFPLTDGVPFPGTNFGAQSENLNDCGGTFYFGDPVVWYSYVGQGGPTTFSTCSQNTDFDTQINIFSGTCGALTCLGGNDQDGGCAFSGDHSTATVCTDAGVTYYVAVYGFFGGVGNFELTATQVTSGIPANDECANAQAISTIGSTTAGSTINACPDDNGFCGTGSNGSSAVWYSFVGQGDWMDFNTCSSTGFDTRLQLFTGTCGALVCEDGNDDGPFGFCNLGSFRSQLIFFADEGVTYYIKVFGFGDGDAGDFELNVDLAPEVNLLEPYDLNNPSFVVILNGVPGPGEFEPISQNNGTNSLLMVRYPDGAGAITGTLAPRGTSLARWDVNIQLRNRKNWTDWSADGGLYKGSNPVAAANHPTWTFSEIAPSSFLSGVPGSGYDGDTLWLAHMPANMIYGMQRGLGANDYNTNFGVSGWFTFSGSYSGTGDVNATITSVDACENSAIGCAPAPVSPMVIALEGASGTNGMRTTLSSNNLLPQSQPFNNTTYNYSGTESFTGSASNVVDWVLVSLRDANNPRSIVARRAALVGQDGTLQNADGTIFNLRDMGSLTQNYYVSVGHNNHLDIMSRTPVSLTNSLDFTKGANQIYQDNSISVPGVKRLPNGKIVMASGDANNDGVIDDLDVADIQNHFHEAGIKNQDLDHDGMVTPQDLRSMLQNRGAASHVPK